MQRRPQAKVVPKLPFQFADFPKLECTRHALGFSPRGTCVGSWYDRAQFLRVVFSLAMGVDYTGHRWPVIHDLTWFSCQPHSPGVYI